ncbi:hypothetical protein A2V80_00910 [Candidatus Woesebacteria bacterium RBG_16_39_8b]|uniref:Uncharacterized protein n=1 Tax=Candidatus Woesebacteria bacterium RBG_16_39_8b TaxID=1802482 RepID=A0A1F7XCR6_9BACT|nr:MAG: hypothetical protein A2V80_00910 [Candidatus Woesebacteria bacterium RBG_16_39_8b]
MGQDLMKTVKLKGISLILETLQADSLKYGNKMGRKLITGMNFRVPIVPSLLFRIPVTIGVIVKTIAQLK